MKTQTIECTHTPDTFERSNVIDKFYCPKCAQSLEIQKRKEGHYTHNVSQLHEATAVDRLYGNEDILIDWICNEYPDIRNYPGYAEPGYTADKSVFMTNWNEYGTVRELLESMGYDTVYNDEYIECYDCYNLVRTTGDCYSWTASYHILNGGEPVCSSCILSGYTEEYLAEISNNTDAAECFDIDLIEHGYEQFNGTFQTGFHRGMNDNPEEIYEQLHGQYDRVIFQIDRSSQFYSDWSVWVK